MKYSICYIDDRIPVEKFSNYFEDTKIIHGSVLNFLIKSLDEWEEEAVRNLISELLGDGEKWSLSAFKNPSFFLNHQKEEIYSPEIILYDWDYGFGPNSDDSEQYLLQILKSTYGIVHVFTHADNEGEVTDVLKRPEFEIYQDRLGLTKKDDVNSVNKVLESAEKRWNSNFSYRFGKELFLNAHSALNKIFVDIAKLSIEQFIASLGHKVQGGKYSIATDNLIGVICEKFKHELYEYDFSVMETPIIVKEDADVEMVRKMWAYRLYYKSKDEVVKKGDIVTRKSDGSLFIVLSSDCHMDAFWNKNYGFISLIPLHKLEDKENLKKRFKALKNEKIKSFSITSLTNTSVKDISILPSIPIEEGTYVDYLLIPKEISSVFIELPEIENIDNTKNSLPLLYEYWPEFSNILSISEPFKSPLIQFIMENITGYGCPDFPISLKKHLNETFTNAVK